MTELRRRCSRRPFVAFGTGGDGRAGHPRVRREAGARERIADAVARHEAKGHAEAAAKGWAFKGAERVLKSSPYSRAKTLEDRRKLNPRYAGDTESIKTAVAREAVFRERYRAARERWLAGDRHVVWPAGTDAMKRRHRVPCEIPD